MCDDDAQQKPKKDTVRHRRLPHSTATHHHGASLVRSLARSLPVSLPSLRLLLLDLQPAEPPAARRVALANALRDFFVPLATS